MRLTAHVRFGGGPLEKDPHAGTSPAAYPTRRRTGGNVRWVSPRWKTRSSSGGSSRC